MRGLGFLSRRSHEVWLRVANRNLSRAFSVHSHLTLEERVLLYREARGRRWIAEIGSYVGASACCFGQAAQESGGKKVICIDTWENEGMSEGLRDTWSEFQSNTAEYEPWIVPVRGSSWEVVGKVREITPNLDLLFIDGDHSYEGVRADWHAYKELLRPGSVIMFHDYGWAEGVQRVVHEDVAPFVSSQQQLPNLWWATLAAS